MVCALNNKLGTIKLSWSSPVETPLFIQATVVKASGGLYACDGLVRGSQGHHDEAVHEEDHGYDVLIAAQTDPLGTVSSMHLS